MRDMYCGDMVVLGDPTVKPHDRIYVNDLYEGFSGQATVKEVVHNFNVNDGFTTAISPDCIITYDDKFEAIVHPYINTIGGIASTAAAYSIGTFLAGKFAKVPGISDVYKVFKESALGKKAAEKAVGLAEDAGEYAEALKAKGGNIKKGVEAAERGAAAAASGARRAKKAATAAKAAITAFKAGLSGTGLGIPIVIAQTLVSYCVTQSISAYIEEKLRNINAVKVYPLERFCIPYTAGLNGSRGLVMSEHADKSVSALKSALGSLVASDNPFSRF